MFTLSITRQTISSKVEALASKATSTVRAWKDKAVCSVKEFNESVVATIMKSVLIGFIIGAFIDIAVFAGFYSLMFLSAGLFIEAIVCALIVISAVQSITLLFSALYYL